jgi:hypothetical protein
MDTDFSNTKIGYFRHIITGSYKNIQLVANLKVALLTPTQSTGNQSWNFFNYSTQTLAFCILTIYF